MIWWPSDDVMVRVQSIQDGYQIREGLRRVDEATWRAFIAAEMDPNRTEPTTVASRPGFDEVPFFEPTYVPGGFPLADVVELVAPDGAKPEPRRVLVWADEVQRRSWPEEVSKLIKLSVSLPAEGTSTAARVVERDESTADGA